MSDIILSNQISTFIKSQFPRFYAEEGPRFIEFIEAYYQWLEQEGMSISQARDLFKLRDVDTTTQIDHFTHKYLHGFPTNALYDKAFLVKHILDIYRSKGSVTGYKLLFKLLYDDDIEIYLPSQDIFAASDGTWYEPKYIELSDNPDNASLVGSIIKGRSSRAEAVVENVIQQPVNNKLVNIAYLSNISGSFVAGERIVSQEHDTELDYITRAPKVLGSLTNLQIVQGGQQFKIGDILVAVDGRGLEAEARVARVANGTGTLAFSVGNGGLLYSMDAIDVISRDPSDNSGRGASFDVGSITSIEPVTYNTDLLLDHLDTVMGGKINSIVVNTSGSGYSNGQLLNFAPNYYIDEITPSNAGISYANGDIVRLSGPNAIESAYCTIVTDSRGRVVTVDMTNPGAFSNATPPTTIDIQEQTNGQGATFDVSMAVSGNGALGYIVTDNSGKVVQARLSTDATQTYSGQGYIVPPVVTVANTSGTGATFTANTNVDLEFNPNYQTNIFTRIADMFNFETKNFGTIGSLTNIATGNNYIAEPKVYVRDLISTRKAQPGQVYYSNTSDQVTGIGTQFTNYKVGDFISLVADPATNKKVDTRIIVDIANNTSMTLDDRALYTSNGVIDRVFVTNGGTGYQNNNTVTVGGPGVGANVTIITDIGGQIIRVNVVRGGSGYYSLPQFTVNSTTGSGANLTAQVTNAVYRYASPLFPANFYLNDLEPRLVANNSYPGTNEIINAPPVFGVGIIRDVQVNNSGFGYEDGEFVRFATYGAVNPIIIVDGGTGYANNDVLSFSGGGPLSSARGVVSTDSKGVVKFVALTYVGSGYKFVPTVRVISKTGTGAELLATIGGLNTQYNVSGYASVDGIGHTKGQFTTTKGFPSSNKYIQDSYYYQEYSYEIQSSMTFTQYEPTVKPLFHPSGLEMFGRVVKTEQIEVSSSTEYDSVEYGIIDFTPDVNLDAEQNVTMLYMLGMYPVVVTEAPVVVDNSSVEQNVTMLYMLGMYPAAGTPEIYVPDVPPVDPDPTPDFVAPDQTATLYMLGMYPAVINIDNTVTDAGTVPGSLDFSDPQNTILKFLLGF